MSNPIRKRDVQIGASYVVRISGKMTTVRIDNEARYGGWDGTNITTGRRVHIKTAAKLRKVVEHAS